MTPKDLVNEYHDLRICTMRYLGPGVGYSHPIENRWVEFHKVDRYVCGYTSSAVAAFKAIRKWLTVKSQLGGSGINMLHDNEEWSVTGVGYWPIPSLTYNQILYTLNGKANPISTEKVARVVSMMTDENAGGSNGLLGADNVYDFLRFFVGVDCNGFIANYVKRVNPAHKHCSIDGYKSGKKREKISELENLDILFPYRKGGQHIAILNRILSRTDKEVHCEVSESRSPGNGGAQTNTWRIRKSGSSWEMLDGPTGTRGLVEIWKFKGLAGVVV